MCLCLIDFENNDFFFFFVANIIIIQIYIIYQIKYKLDHKNIIPIENASKSFNIFHDSIFFISNNII